MLLRTFARGIAAGSYLLACGCAGVRLPVTAPGYPVGTTLTSPMTADFASSADCRVSADGFLWYGLPAGTFAPIDFTHVRCASRTSIDASAVPPVPRWAQRPASTQAIFVATSLQEAYSAGGMAAIETDAAGSHVPVTWMIGNTHYLDDAGLAAYEADHVANGDDVELEEGASLYVLAARLPWYAPSVSVEGAGHERRIAALRALGDDAFWGVTWNSHGTDATSDEGAPFGSYCADLRSYKRPAPDGSCALVSFEWTARDLTRSFFTNTNPSGYSSEAAFSTDPDDALLRGGFDESSAIAYERALVDAYAAAGEYQPLVMMSQQETAEEGTRGPADDPVLAAIYDESQRSGMHAMTLRSADAVARTFSSLPRAAAFPYLSGGIASAFDGAPFTPATIDYHDAAAGMTFVAGRTMPDRVFEYADDPVSVFNQVLPAIVPGSSRYPQLTGVSAAGGSLQFAFVSPAPMHFGIAVWTDAAALGVREPSVARAGHAGFVVAFDLPAGASTQTLPCVCQGTAFPYAR